MSTMATRHWQSWKKRRWSSSLTTPSAASSPIWTPSGYGSASARCCSVRRWRSQITARRSTRICGSSASPPSRVIAAVCSLSAGHSRRCRAVHRRTTGRNHRRSVNSCFRIIRQKLPAFMRLSQLCMQNVANAS